MKDVNQILNLIQDIQNCNDENIAFLRKVELVRMILEELDVSSLDNERIENMTSQEIFPDICFEVDDSSKILSDFILKNIEYIEEEFKGSNIGIKIKEEAKRINQLKEEFLKKQKEHKELQEVKKEAEAIKKEIKSIYIEMEEYINIDLEKVKSEKENLLKKLNIIREEEENNLIIYRKHLATNQKIKLQNDKIIEISSEISSKLKQMDNLYTQLLLEEDS